MIVNVLIAITTAAVIYAIVRQPVVKIVVIEPELHFTPAKYVPLAGLRMTTDEESYQDSIWR